MKKLLFLTILFLVSQFTIVRAAQPIPVRHARVYHVANFLEQFPGGHSPFLLKSTREKRDMMIQASTATGGPKSSVVVYVYSTDMNEILGPFTVEGGETLSVPIDDREWGVVVTSDDHMYVDIYTSDSQPRY
jgi:hypothetical protein